MTEERIKCECCDELFPRSLYDKHWAALSTNPTRAWRYIPLDQIMPTSRLLDDLERAGYSTAGDVLDAEADDLAAEVYGVGLRRAELIRQKVFDHVKPFGSQGEPQWVLVTPEAARPAPRPRIDVLNLLLGFSLCALMAAVLALLMVALP